MPQERSRNLKPENKKIKNKKMKLPITGNQRTNGKNPTEDYIPERMTHGIFISLKLRELTEKNVESFHPVDIF